jgi:6-pyruvoyltetrahydropterin/6-carboxytetrahydropterin synthase
MPGDRKPGLFRVSVTKDYLTFSAAHFITIADHKCESLHGHNYVVQVAVEGSVDPETGFVVDFAVLKRILRPTIDRLDHRVLVPTLNQGVKIRTQGSQTLIDYRGEARFVFPASNVAPVPVTDTTAELLAEYLAGEMVSGLANEGLRGLSRIGVEVEESPGQCGAYTIEIGRID